MIYWRKAHSTKVIDDSTNVRASSLLSCCMPHILTARSIQPGFRESRSYPTGARNPLPSPISRQSLDLMELLASLDRQTWFRSFKLRRWLRTRHFEFFISYSGFASRDNLEPADISPFILLLDPKHKSFALFAQMDHAILRFHTSYN